MKNWQAFFAAFYGFVVIASGVLRYVEREGGEKGLWFGVIMGSIAIAAAIAFYFQKKFNGNLLLWFSLTVTGGWFIYEALIKKGYANAEPRMLFIIALTGLTAVLSTGLSRLSSSVQNKLEASDAG